MTAATRLRELPPGPLGESLTRVSERQGRFDLRYGRPAEPGWATCAELLAEPERFDRWRAGLGGWLRQQYGESHERTTAGYVMSWYLWVPAYVGGLLFHHERRVPALGPADLAFRMARPRPHPDAMAVLSPGFACLPDDPAAGTPGADVVADERALAAVLRGRFAGHAARFVDAYGKTVRMGKRMLWAAATDALDNALWLSGRYSGDEGAGVLDAGLVLEGGPAPFTSASTLRPVGGDGGPVEWTRRRESCCFHYLLDNGQGTCSTCPRLSRKNSGDPCGARDE
ncbi:(2Fe-2S)-binding protein [Actinokineospora pegani]|uniref:(2Fe-2S)-binding protein n=1 Tax=Actinokineospora pegani TaxID=2654637 RepID=UPI0018D388F1